MKRRSEFASKVMLRDRSTRRRWRSQHFTCTLLALFRKCPEINGAGEGNRTLVSGLGSPHSTIEPHPHRVFRFLQDITHDASANQIGLTDLPQKWGKIIQIQSLLGAN